MSDSEKPRGTVPQVLTSPDEQVDAAGRRHVGVGHVASSSRPLLAPPRPLEQSSRSRAEDRRRRGRQRESARARRELTAGAQAAERLRHRGQ